MGLRKNPQQKKSAETNKQTPSKRKLQLRCIIHTQLHNKRLQLEAERVLLAQLDRKYHRLAKEILSKLIKTTLKSPQRGITLDKKVQSIVKNAFAQNRGITAYICTQLKLCTSKNFKRYRDTQLLRNNITAMGRLHSYTINRYFERKGLLKKSSFRTGFSLDNRKTHTFLKTLLIILEKISQAFENCTKNTPTQLQSKPTKKPQKKPAVKEKSSNGLSPLEQKIIRQADKIPGISTREMTRRLRDFKKHFNLARNYLLYGRFARGIDQKKREKYGITAANITLEKYLPLVFAESMFDNKTFDPTRRSNSNTFGYFQLYKSGRNFPAAVEIRNIFGLSRITLNGRRQHFTLTNKTHNVILGILYYQICEKKSDLSRVMVRVGQYKNIATLSPTDRKRLTRAIYNKGDYVRRLWINMHPTPKNYDEFEAAISQALFASMREKASPNKRAIHPHHKFKYQELGAVAQYKAIIERLEKKYLKIKKPKKAIFKRKKAAFAKRAVYLNFNIKGKIVRKKIRFPLGQLIEMLDYVRIQEGITALKLPKTAPKIKYARSTRKPKRGRR